MFSGRLFQTAALITGIALLPPNLFGAARLRLHDAEIWKPQEDCVLTHVWRRIHTILGWALIPIALAAWTGMLSR